MTTHTSYLRDGVDAEQRIELLEDLLFDAHVELSALRREHERVLSLLGWIPGTPNVPGRAA